MVLIVAGAALLGLTVFDVLRTTVAVGSVAGPVSGRLTHWLWALALRRGSHEFLRLAGLAITLTAVFLWFAALWAGWSLVFLGSEDAVVSVQTGRPAGGWDRVYFAGYTMFTLGNGDFAPRGTPWQLLTVMSVASGLGLVTLGITYLVPVTSAATHKRQLATCISGLGERPDAMVAQAWDGEGFDRLQPHLDTLIPMLALLAQQHLAYPVLHYFHNVHRFTAAPPRIAALDEMLTLLEFGVDPSCRPPPYALHPVRQTLSHFLDTLHSAFIDPEPQPPPVPSLRDLRDAGIRTVADEDFAAAVEKLAQRRRLLGALVDNDGWRWSDVWTAVGHDLENPSGAGETA